MRQKDTNVYRIAHYFTNESGTMTAYYDVEVSLVIQLCAERQGRPALYYQSGFETVREGFWSDRTAAIWLLANRGIKLEGQIYPPS